MRATVVLPDPDSPTMASDVPAAMENDTSSTATKDDSATRRRDGWPSNAEPGDVSALAAAS